MKKINIGVIGLGRIGKVHLESLMYRLPKAKVVAAADVNKKTHAFAKAIGVETVYTDYKEIINHPDIQGVIICSPTFTHLPYIEEVARAGKHIFCEKPLELTIEKIKKIDAIIEQTGVKLQVGFNRRFDANFAKVRTMVQKGKIGDPHILKISSRDPAPPPIEYIKGSGGIFLDMTIHDFDMARFVVDSEVTEVYAKGAVLVDKAIGAAGDIDTALITLTFENGCIGVIDNSRKSVYGYDQRLEIFGSKGMSQIGNNHHDAQLLYDKKGGHSALPLDFFMDRYTEAYFKEMQVFIEAIEKDKAIPVGSKDALMATAIAIAAKKSIIENRAVRIAEIL